MLTAAFLLALAAPAGAQAPAAVDAPLLRLRHQALQLRSRQARARDLRLLQEIQRMDRTAAALAAEARRLEGRLDALRRRAGASGRGDDLLRYDLQKLIWSLRDLNDKIAREADLCETLSRQASPDAAQARAAESLERRARALAADADRLLRSARLGEPEFAGAGYSLEGWQARRHADDARRSSSLLERSCRSLLVRLRTAGR